MYAGVRRGEAVRHEFPPHPVSERPRRDALRQSMACPVEWAISTITLGFKRSRGKGQRMRHERQYMDVLAKLQTKQEPSAPGAALKFGLGFHNATLLGQGWQAPG